MRRLFAYYWLKAENKNAWLRSVAVVFPTDYRSAQNKEQERHSLKLPGNFQLRDGEQSVGVSRKRALLYITLCTCKLSTALPVANILSFWEICKCVHLRWKHTHTQISHFICLWFVYQTLPTCCRSISRWGKKKDFESISHSMQVWKYLTFQALCLVWIWHTAINLGR